MYRHISPQDSKCIVTSLHKTVNVSSHLSTRHIGLKVQVVFLGYCPSQCVVWYICTDICELPDTLLFCPGGIPNCRRSSHLCLPQVSPYIHTYTHMRARTHTYICAHTCAYIRTYIHTYRHTHTYIHYPKNCFT